MLSKIKDFFNQSASLEGKGGESREQVIQKAACALMIEMANIDDEFSEDEKGRIVAILKKEFDLSEEMAHELIDLSHEELEGSVDLWQFTSLINQNYSPEEKIQLMELVWRVVYADGHLDQHEDYLVKKIAHLLNLRHGEMIDAKLKVLGRSR
ncbi:MAG: TerB family tellurite resistance protein [Deltaproteobacteria bacterium]|nr:TerB family tellurite resistance protein [Deltaproteobacteria bacterium]